MKRINKIRVWTKGWLWFSFFAAIILLAASCQNEDDAINDPYARLGVTTETKSDSIIGNDYVFRASNSGMSQYFFVYTNVGDWILSVEESNRDWAVIWPEEGSNDGRFGVRLLPNDQATTRRATVYLLDSKGQVRGRLPIEQTGSAPYMNVGFTGREKRPSYLGETFTIQVSANIAWYADNGGTEWIQLGETTETSQEIVIGENPGATERSGELTFYMVGGSQKVTIVIIQADKSSSYEYATLTTVADLLSTLPGGVGTVADNVYIDAYVTSDRATESIVSVSSEGENWIQQTKLMTVQDESGRGILFEFDNPDDNVYNLHDKLKIHMYGVTVSEDPTTGDRKISAFSSSNVKEQTPGASGATPVELNDLDNIDDYDNTLVTLKDMEFAIPFGTYVNIQESAHNLIASNWTATAEPFADNTYEYGHILRDTKGNLIKLYTPVSFTEKYARIMPKGSGSMTGIVMKRIKNSVKSSILRIRRDSDNQLSDDPSSALSMEVMRMGPWETNALLSSVTATVGTGTLYQTTRSAQNVITSGGPNFMYWASAFCRITPDLPDALYMINNQSWWRAIASILPDRDGEAWVISTSTAGYTGAGKMFLQFISSSSTSGPCLFTAEWAESVYTPASAWKSITDYTICDVNNSKQRMQYCFELPDEVKGKNELAIRLRVRENKRATMNNSSIGSTGSNCIGLISITQLKN